MSDRKAAFYEYTLIGCLITSKKRKTGVKIMVDNTLQNNAASNTLCPTENVGNLPIGGNSREVNIKRLKHRQEAVVKNTAKRKERFLRHLEGSFFLTQAASDGHVAYSTVKRWLKDDQDFRERVDNVRRMLVDKLSRKAVDLAMNGDKEMLRFLLRTLGRDIFAERIEIENEVNSKVVHIHFDAIDAAP